LRIPEFGSYASASQAALYLWDANQGAQVGLPMTGSPATIRSLAFSDQDGMLYTGLSNGSLQAWSMFSLEWIDQACQAANRDLTQSEWETYFPGQDYSPTCTNR
jgi:WD40 repeat protein